jgi:hypothetical protein
MMYSLADFIVPLGLFFLFEHWLTNLSSDISIQDEFDKKNKKHEINPSYRPMLKSEEHCNMKQIFFFRGGGLICTGWR